MMLLQEERPRTEQHQSNQTFSPLFVGLSDVVVALRLTKLFMHISEGHMLHQLLSHVLSATQRSLH